jgi:hypothetical protein
MLAALRASPINPKENKKKKRQKKRKKKATISSGEALGCQGFLEKNTTSQTYSVY